MKYWEEKGQPELLNMVGGRAKNIAEQAGVPGFGNKQLSQALTAGVLSTIAQGGGIAAGGLTGMLGSNWLADKLLTLATKKKLLKKRPRLHALIRDLSGLLGAGLGAYGTMRLMNRVIPAYANRGEAAAAGAEKGTADAKAPQQPAAQQSAATAAAKAVGQEAAKPAGK
jgi:hypothetical protein